MLTQLNEKLALLTEQDRQRQKFLANLEKITTDLTAQTQKQNALKAVLQKEKADVDSLNGFSLKGIFYSVLGTKEVELREENQEYLTAQLKYTECSEVLQDLDMERRNLEQQLLGFKHLDGELKAVLTEKEAFLAAQNDATTLQLNQLAEDVAKAEAAGREVSEAITAGYAAWKSLCQVIEALKDAKDWGTWDMVGGGGMATMLKHDKLDDAKVHMHRTQQLLRQFNYELADVTQHQEILVNIDGFDTFSDYFFDNLIFDWMVQEKINRSLSNNEQLSNRLQNILTDLTTKREQLQKQVTEKKHARFALIQTA